MTTLHHNLSPVAARCFINASTHIRSLPEVQTVCFSHPLINSCSNFFLLLQVQIRVQCAQPNFDPSRVFLLLTTGLCGSNNFERMLQTSTHRPPCFPPSTAVSDSGPVCTIHRSRPSCILTLGLCGCEVIKRASCILEEDRRGYDSLGSVIFQYWI